MDSLNAIPPSPAASYRYGSIPPRQRSFRWENFDHAGPDERKLKLARLLEVTPARVEELELKRRRMRAGAVTATRLDLRPGQARRRGRSAPHPPALVQGLAALEFALLNHLAADPARCFTKQELLRDVWGYRSSGKRRR
jgi:hypothetical protein